MQQLLLLPMQCSGCAESACALQLDSTWQIMEDSEHHLRLRKVMRTKNFKKVSSCEYAQVTAGSSRVVLKHAN